MTVSEMVELEEVQGLVARGREQGFLSIPEVAKSVEGGKTKVVIQALGREERVKELARMIGGVNITQKTLDAAHEMLGG